MADAKQEVTDGEPDKDQNVLSKLPVDITHQYIKDLSFESPQSQRIFVGEGAIPEISIQVSANAEPLGEQRFEAELFLNARATYEGQVVFIAELQYGAHVVIGDVEDEVVQPLLFIEVPRLLFPFARQILSNVVREGGFPPLLMAPIDFLDLYTQGIEVAQDEDEKN